MRTLLALLLLLIPSPLFALSLQEKALGILHTHCYSCHGKTKHGDPNYDVSNLPYLVDPANDLITPGNPEKSRLFSRIVSGEMPPDPKKKLSEGEIQTLKTWILELGKKEATTPPKPLPTKDLSFQNPIKDKVLQAPNSYVRQWIAKDGYHPGSRYLVLNNIYNKGRDERLLSHTRAAVSKLVNSLSFSPQIVAPKAIDPLGLVLRIDLSAYGLLPSDWDSLLNVYPYDGAPAFIRADWFIANASRPPLYYNLLHLPGTAQELEARLGVNRDRNFRLNVSKRAGITNSTVAFHNRILEWNPSIYGAYWISYDFGNSDEQKSIIRNPLGPVSRQNPFVDADFEHDADEIIGSLPNGLHFYYVNDKNGKRLDKADETLVVDRSLISGDAAIRPGINCMTCHTQGMQMKVEDVVRNGNPLIGLERLKTLALFPDQKTFAKLLERDRDKYVNSLKLATTPFLPANSFSNGQVVEPITTSVTDYNQPLNLEQAALELGLRKEVLRNFIAASGDLQFVGLRPLLTGQTITRDAWQTTEFGISPFQRILQAIGQ